jgi:hypothetical protein
VRRAVVLLVGIVAMLGLVNGPPRVEAALSSCSLNGTYILSGLGEAAGFLETVGSLVFTPNGACTGGTLGGLVTIRHQGAAATNFAPTGTYSVDVNGVVSATVPGIIDLIGFVSLVSNDAVANSVHLVVTFTGPQVLALAATRSVPTGALQGAPGPSGSTGPAGPQGVAGPTGPAGPAGPTGAQGPAGSVGTQGPQGPQGAQGPVGTPGPQGQVGPQGPQGLQGSQGLQGQAGATGPTGPGGIGATGPTGVAGPSKLIFGYRSLTPLADGQFFVVYGNTNLVTSFTQTTTVVDNEVAAQAGTASNLSCVVANAVTLGSGNKWRFALTVDETGTLICEIGDNQRTCSNSGSTTIATGQRVTLQLTKIGTPPASGNNSCTFEFQPS